MSNAVVNIHDEFAFQSRYFWLKATALLDPGKAVMRVGFESGPKGFDEVWVEHALDRGPLDPAAIRSDLARSSQRRRPAAAGARRASVARICGGGGARCWISSVGHRIGPAYAFAFARSGISTNRLIQGEPSWRVRSGPLPYQDAHYPEI